MSSIHITGTAGYADRPAKDFHEWSEIVSFETVHAPVLDLLPAAPARLLDIGAGTGRDAAALAEQGFHVVAVEPSANLRELGSLAHPSPAIEWVDDHLPHLNQITACPEQYDAVLITAVWIHLDEDERRQAMPTIAALLRPGGIVLISLRHGPVPVGRVMYEVGGDETIHLAAAAGLSLLRRLDDQPSAYPRTDVTWTRLAFAAPVRPEKRCSGSVALQV